MKQSSRSNKAVHSECKPMRGVEELKCGGRARSSSTMHREMVVILTEMEEVDS